MTDLADADDYAQAIRVGTALMHERNELRSKCARLRAALSGLKRGTCWCDVAIGNPIMSRHSSACEAAEAALDSLETVKGLAK